MLWKGVLVLSFARFLRFLKTASFAAILLFDASNTYASTSCGSGQQSQTNVFAAYQHCGVPNSIGYEHTGSGQTVSSLYEGDGTWISYFPNFRVKGRAYCSTTTPGEPDVGVACDSIPRRPTAETINTVNNGAYCWCQAPPVVISYSVKQCGH